MAAKSPQPDEGSARTCSEQPDGLVARREATKRIRPNRKKSCWLGCSLQLDCINLYIELYLMQKKIIAIIGGPGTGKSTLIEELKSRGFCCYPEISRQVTIEAQKNGVDQLFLTDPLLFSKMLIDGRIKQHEDALLEPYDVVFVDRGIPDVVAYMDYIGDEYPDDFVQICNHKKYSQAFILPPWRDIYVSDNERYESFEEAVVIQKHLIDTYQKYGYDLIEVPLDTVQKRVDFVLENL
ncbi:MAG: hypothetical protein RLZZ312_497 [Bacteroidota bacterium]|jgi:predicted ATPase